MSKLPFFERLFLLIPVITYVPAVVYGAFMTAALAPVPEKGDLVSLLLPGAGWAIAGGIALWGILPRKLILGSKTLSGPALLLFETLRALAVAAPLFPFAFARPAAALAAIAATASLTWGLRAAAQSMFTLRGRMRKQPYARRDDEKPLNTLRKLNSLLIVANAAIVAVSPAWLASGGPSPLWLLPSAGVFAAISLMLLLLSHHALRSGLEAAFSRHMDDFLRHCTTARIKDAIHYAGGSIKDVQSTAAKLKTLGRPVVVLARDISSYKRANDAGLKTYLVRALADLDAFVLPSLERMHYTANTQRAGHVVRFGWVSHILHLKFLPASVRGLPGYLAMYDAIACTARPNPLQQMKARESGLDLIEPHQAAVYRKVQPC
ncbi:hypothetical protein [Leisingera caerulea]|uniref:hypothetical protein n=1 Tax=Leisingera caerulea TaxID=506591 RepID=UPI0004273BB7|nr:hypothetical protein [Leisingera caerulea]